jgi:hypothetical protein
MVGCGGFGAATAAVAIMVKAAAKEPAIVAAVMTLLEFMGDPFQKSDLLLTIADVPIADVPIADVPISPAMAG